MPEDVLTPVWSGQRCLAPPLELPLPDPGCAPSAAQRREGLPRGLRPGPRPDGERPGLGARHHRLAQGRPRPEPRARLHPVHPARPPPDQPDRGPAELRGLLLPTAQRLPLTRRLETPSRRFTASTGGDPRTVRHTDRLVFSG